MFYGIWDQIRKKLEEENKIIFKDLKVEKLSSYEKRKIIYNYLCENIKYDYSKLFDIYLSTIYPDIEEQIFNNKEQFIISVLNDYQIFDPAAYKALKDKVDNMNYEKGRNPYLELESVINNHVGICNGISQYYKLLLEINGIYSVCVICDNMTPRNHQINLVYDDENKTYSFDDVTSAIIDKEKKESCFDYDIEMAKELNQGIRPVGYLISHGKEIDDMYDSFGIILSSDVINLYVGKKDKEYLKYELEKNNNINLPNNIISMRRMNNLTSRK